jgi:hypothetical protein
MDEGFKIAGVASLGALSGLIINKVSPTYVLKNVGYTSIANGIIGLVLAFGIHKMTKSKMAFLFVGAGAFILIADGLLQLALPAYAV